MRYSTIIVIMDTCDGPEPLCLADRVWTLLLQVSFDRAHRYFGATAADLDLAPAVSTEAPTLTPTSGSAPPTWGSSRGPAGPKR